MPGIEQVLVGVADPAARYRDGRVNLVDDGGHVRRTDVAVQDALVAPLLDPLVGLAEHLDLVERGDLLGPGLELVGHHLGHQGPVLLGLLDECGKLVQGLLVHVEVEVGLLSRGEDGLVLALAQLVAAEVPEFLGRFEPTLQDDLVHIFPQQCDHTGWKVLALGFLNVLDTRALDPNASALLAK